MARILVVDDIPANVQILSIHLSDEGYEVCEALSGEEALKRLQEADQKQAPEIDLILLDVMMPAMSGLDVLAELKRQPETQHIPVILVTANADERNVAEGLDLGAFDYIIKPFSLVILLARVRTALREKERQDLLEKWATTDPLTELLNRRHFFDLAERELERARRLKSPISFIMIDIDYFKNVNDKYGHIIGDKTLVHLAELLIAQLRIIDFCCRYGGEEFVLCLPDTPKTGALEVAERIREAASAMVIQSKDQPDFSISISLGIAVGNENEPIESILKRADQALYHAKSSGRNQSQVA